MFASHSSVGGSPGTLHGLLLVLVSLATAYMAFGRPRVDLLSIACATAVAYYLPIIMGVIDFRHHTGPESPAGETYFIVAAVFLVVLVATVFYDCALVRQRSPRPFIQSSGGTAVLFALAVVLGLAAFWHTSWSDLMSTDKHRLMEQSSPTLRSLMSMAAGMLPIVAVCRRRLWLSVLAFVPAILVLFLGFRFPVLWAACGAILILARSNLRRPVALSGRGIAILALGLATFAGVMVYKHVYMAVKSTDQQKIEASLHRLSNQPERVLAVSEPQSICTLLDQSVKTGFRLSKGHMMDAATSVVTPGSGWRHRNFNAQFQGRYYANRRGKMGNSPLAELYAWGQMPATLIGVAVWGVGMVLFTVLIQRSRSTLIAAATTLAGLVWVVNVHRNDVRYTVVLVAAVFVLAAVAWCGSWVFRTIASAGGDSATRPADAAREA